VQFRVMLHDGSPDAVQFFHETFDQRWSCPRVADLVRSVLKAAKVQDPEEELLDLIPAHRFP
jgi:hypothetical protein